MRSDTFDLDSILADFYDDHSSSAETSTEPEPAEKEEVFLAEPPVNEEYSTVFSEKQADTFDEYESIKEESLSKRPGSVAKKLSYVLPLNRKPRMKKRTRRALVTLLLCFVILLAASVMLWAILNIGGKSKKAVSIIPSGADLSRPVTETILHLESIVTGEEIESPQDNRKDLPSTEEFSESPDEVIESNQ